MNTLAVEATLWKTALHTKSIGDYSKRKELCFWWTNSFTLEKTIFSKVALCRKEQTAIHSCLSLNLPCEPTPLKSDDHSWCQHWQGGSAVAPLYSLKLSKSSSEKGSELLAGFYVIGFNRREVLSTFLHQIKGKQTYCIPCPNVICQITWENGGNHFTDRQWTLLIQWLILVSFCQLIKRSGWQYWINCYFPTTNIIIWNCLFRHLNIM